MKKGAFVKVSGLQSKAGAKLNGAFGMVISDIKPSSGEGVSRRPVFIFAFCKENGALEPVLVDAPLKKIKDENLTEMIVDGTNEEEVLALFRRSVLSHGQSAYELGTFDKVIQVLVKECAKYFPEDVDICVYSALSLVETASNFAGAAAILKPLLPKVLSDDADELLKPVSLPLCYENVLEMYSGFCGIFSRAGELYLQDAFDCAMKICDDSSTSVQIQTAMGALEDVQGASSAILQNTQIHQDPAIVSLLVKSCEMAVKIDPEGEKNPKLVGKFASALSIAGDSLGACKHHRKVLAMENLHKYPGLEEKEKRCLVLSQLQCPGMPLEDVIVLSSDDDQATCLKKSDAEGCFMGLPHIPGGPFGLVSVGSPPNIFHYTLPSDPDDPDVFPTWLLEQIKPDEE